MISHIRIHDFAIIENAEVDFYPGLNILTGETGSGKSIVVEAISLVLGARADAALIRSGKEKAVVQLAGDIDGEEIVITREVSAAGKNLCRLNGELVTLAQLNTYCRRLADIHGQYDHQSLLNPDNHIRLVDLYHKDEMTPAKNKVSELYSAFRDARQALDRLLTDAAENTRKRDFMRFEADEIRNANLRVGEDLELEEQILLMQNSEKIYRALSEICELGKDGSPSVMDLLSHITALLSTTSPYSPSLAEAENTLTDLFYNLEDCFREIRNARDRVTFTPAELDDAIHRADTINRLKQKYGKSIPEILAYAEKTEQALLKIENIEEEQALLEKKLQETETALNQASLALTALRKASAAELEKKISEELRELNFADSRIQISFHELPAFTENGRDRVEFLISTNRGEPLKPLAKIASGGEMSRIMLAFKNIIADYDNIPTLIFDEIDTGISGITASIVGQKLRQIADGHQIICITHLPQIAACADHSYRIQKEISKDATKTNITEIRGDEKVHEIARLLGGMELTDAALRNAKDLISSSVK